MDDTPTPDQWAKGNPGLRALGPRFLRLVLSLLLLVVVWLPMFVIYGLGSGSIAFLGNCGPEGFIGQDGHYVGGSAATLPTARLIGLVLLIASAVAVWLLRRTAIVVFTFALLYLVALIVLAIVAPTVWGHRHCVLY